MTMNRKQFLTSLLGLATAPLALRALVPPQQPIGIPLDLVYDTKAADHLRAQGLDDYGHPRAILVPSNRWHRCVTDPSGTHNWHEYRGEWDGTLKLERGCENPAYVLADLTIGDPHYTGPWPGWGALYDWGVYCDEMVCDWARFDGSDHAYGTPKWAPRYTVTSLTTSATHHTAALYLRDHLRMHFLSWRATDPRYRRSWPVMESRGDSLHVIT